MPCSFWMFWRVAGISLTSASSVISTDTWPWAWARISTRRSPWAASVRVALEILMVIGRVKPSFCHFWYWRIAWDATHISTSGINRAWASHCRNSHGECTVPWASRARISASQPVHSPVRVETWGWYSR